jgi:Amt family ammonium transporter
MTGTLRVSEEGLMQGLDLHEHGVDAYPEFVVSRGLGNIVSSVPAGMAAPAGAGARLNPADSPSS